MILKMFNSLHPLVRVIVFICMIPYFFMTFLFVGLALLPDFSGDSIGLTYGRYLLQKVDEEGKKEYPWKLIVAGSYDYDGNFVWKEPEVAMTGIYGYCTEGDYTYIASDFGYARLHEPTSYLEILFLNGSQEKVDHPDVRFLSDTSSFTAEELAIFKSIPREYLAYKVKNAVYVGHGRFQVKKNPVKLQVYGLYGEFSRKSTLLSNITGYSITSANKLYVTSRRGYAIIDGPSGICRVYFTDEGLKDKAYEASIQVLEAYEDFSPTERVILEQVEDSGLQ